ncbi:MAG TPA: PIN domain-containing protein [Candidatus Bathyarchaeia archaeon]|nr:PIN domain-containing protein [Candidatus Bathyarchaeia archaeon]
MDTSAWKAYYDEEDELHGEARNLMNAISSREISVRAFITSDCVMDETITLIRFAHSHGKAAEFARAILSSRATRIVYVGEEAFLKALGLFQRVQGQGMELHRLRIIHPHEAVEHDKSIHLRPAL